jgi:hypothetical protein
VVRAGELLATRWARHETFARPELCEQIARFFGDAKSRESVELVPALAAAQDGIRAHVGQDGEGFQRSAPSCVRSEVQQPWYVVCLSMWGSVRPIPPLLYVRKSR